jgi:hypothetical protein
LNTKHGFAQGDAAERERIKQLIVELLPELLGAMAPADPSNVFLSESQVEERWGASKGYCAELRAQGNGPKFVRLSPRMVRYRLAVIAEYERNRTFASNAEELVERNEEPQTV